MITVDSLSMVLNDSRAAVAYNMDVTERVLPATTMQEVVRIVLRTATARRATIKNLVLTAHGLPGSFQLGAGLNSTTMAPFADLAGKVYKIWFRGCLVGRIMGPGAAADGDAAALRGYGITSGNGHAFLSAFAILTGCYVVAPTEMQVSAQLNYSRGVMDSYEGLVLSYDPRGRITWQQRYPSLYGHDVAARTAQNPNRE